MITPARAMQRRRWIPAVLLLALPCAVAQGKGMIGSSADYLRQTCEELLAHGIADDHLFQVHEAVFGAAPKPKAV